MKRPLTLILLLVPLLSSCTAAGGEETVAPDTPATTTAPSTSIRKIPTGYELFEENDRHYIRFLYDETAETDVDGGNIGGAIMAAGVSFSSIQELFETVTEGKLTIRQLRHIEQTFPKDEIGIMICDFNRLSVSIAPQDFMCKTVNWSGESYTFGLSSEGNLSAYCLPLSEESYTQRYQAKYKNFFENENIVILSSEIVEDRNATVTHYQTSAGTLKEIQYVLEIGEKTISVSERYFLSVNSSGIPDSDIVPVAVYLYGTTGDLYFEVGITGLSERPSVEWLSEFGIEPYTYEE